MRKFLLVAGVLAAYIFPQAAAGQSFRESCTRDRCVIYDRTGKRVATSEQIGSRLVIRGNDYKVRAKVTERDNGSYRVEKPRR